MFTRRRINHTWATGRQTKEGISRSFSVSRSANLSPEWLMECKIHSSSLMSLSLRYNLCWCSEKKKKKGWACVSMPWCGINLETPHTTLHTHPEHLFMGNPSAIKQLLELLTAMFADSDVGYQSILIILTARKKWLTTRYDIGEDAQGVWVVLIFRIHHICIFNSFWSVLIWLLNPVKVFLKSASETRTLCMNAWFLFLFFDLFLHLSFSRCSY